MSANNPAQFLVGVDSIRGAEAVRMAQADRRGDWPYVHLFPPPNSTDVLRVATLETSDPATGIVEVLSYRVPSGKRFYLRAVVLGANVTIVPGDALFTVDRNQAVGATNSQYNPEHGLINIPIQLGNLQGLPWHLQRPREFAALDVIRVKATNVNLAVGAPNYFVCGIFGYEVPVMDLHANR